jgi:hypothetical protein
MQAISPAIQMIFYVVQDKKKSSAHCNIKPTTARIDCNLTFHKLFPHATQEDSTRHWRTLVRIWTIMSFNRFRWINSSRSLTRERERDLQLLASYWIPWCQDMRMHHRKSRLKTWLMIGARRRQLFVMYKKARTDIDVCDIPFLLQNIVDVQISNYFKDFMNIYC